VETRLVSALLNHPAMTFPLFIKPIGGTGSSGIDILFSAADLAKYADNADQYIVQDYLIPSSWNISGRDIKRDQVIRHNSPIQRDEFSVQHLVSHSGEIIATFMSSSSLKLGTPVHVTPIWDDTVYEISRKMVEALIPEGLVGPINLECKLTAAGVFFYEINPRFTTLSAVRAMLGFNECAAMVEDIIFSKSAVALKSQLEIDYNSVCSRYVSEIVVKAAAFNRLIDQGELDNTEAGTERL
ncbi:MAG: hypothetical protein NTV45_09650, partial [Firmicutes bacterium]|nr:hypothetical protein [Bacillota bacterium]